MTTIYKFKAYFTKDGVGYTPTPAPTCTVINVDTDAAVATPTLSASATVVGLYSASYSGADGLDLAAKFQTSDTGADQQCLVSYTAGVLYTIQTDLGNPSQYKADVSSLATEATQLQILGRLSSNPLPQLLVSVAGSTISDIRGNDWAISISGVTLTGKIQFAIKKSDSLPDSLSEIFVDSVTGLIVQKGLPSTTPQLAQLTYSGDTLTIVVDASVTAQLAKGTYVYGIQSVSTSGEVLERYGGKFVVQGDVVRATE